MASLMEQVFGAMPLAAAAANTAAWAGSFQAAKQSTLYYYCQPLPPGDFQGTPVAAPLHTGTAKTDGNNKEIPLWSYAQGSTPNVFDKLGCRVVTDAFRSYVVCDEVRVGSSLSPVGLDDTVVVRVLDKPYYLPLSPEFLIATFRTRDGLENPARSSVQLAPGTPPVRLYPLEATYDASTVHAYVYDLPIETNYIEDPDAPPVGEPVAVKSPLSVTDPDAYARLRGNLARASDVAAGVAAKKEEYANQKGPETEGEAELVQDTLLKDDDWMPVPEEVWAETNGPTAGVMPLPARVLVLISLTVCRERSDFTPALGGMIELTGAARFYPQVLVKATIPVETIKTSVRFTRAAQTTIDDGSPCGCHEMKETVHPGLYTDRNGIVPVPHPAGIPFGLPGVALGMASGGPTWALIFDYYSLQTMEETQGIQKTGPEPITVVNPALTKKRTLKDAVDRQGQGGSSDVTKLPRQGAFDNIHFAPRMKFPPGTRVFYNTWDTAKHPGILMGDVKVEAGHVVTLEDIVMAPICAHDCFHMHWRWTDSSVQEPQMGWSESAPNAVPGGTMIPHHHTLQFRVEAENQFVLTETSLPDKPIAADTFELFYSFGGAFAVSASTFGMNAIRAQLAADSQVFYVDPANPSEVLNATNSWAAFYATIQYWFALDSADELVASQRLQLNVPIKTLMAL